MARIWQDQAMFVDNKNRSVTRSRISAAARASSNGRASLLASLVFSFALCAQAQTISYSYTDLVERLTNLQHLATIPAPEDRCAQWSSYDRASYYDAGTGQYMNWSANGDGSGIIRTEGNQVVLAEMQGPGCIWRMWSATPGAGHVRIYLDGTNSPTIDLPFSSYFDRSSPPFTFPALVHTTAANGWNNYVPIPYQTSCKITADSNWGAYYHFTYETFPTNTQVPTFTGSLSAAESAALENVNQFLLNCGSDPAGVRPGEIVLTNVVTARGSSTQLVAQVAGPRAITAIRVQTELPPSPADYDALRELALQINWDGDTNPAVWVPLGDFFGTAPGTNAYASLPLGCGADGSWYCYWYMPFATDAQVRLINDGTNEHQVRFEITHAPLTKPIEQLARFHAKWHRDFLLPTEPGRSIDWTMLKTTGTGRYVGVMLHVWNPRGGWWGEGDEKFFVDGEKFPSTFGTGSEDYFGYAWSSPVLFRHAYHNQTHNDGGSKGHVSVNRWQLGESVPFQQSFEGCIEKYFGNSRPTLYAATAYWYLAPDGVDPYPPVPLSGRVGYWTPLVNYRVPGAIEGETMQVLALSAGTAQRQDMSGFTDGQWSNDAQLWWTGAHPDDVLDLALEVTNAGTYKLSARLTEARDYAIVQLFLDGEALGSPIDLYNPSVVPTSELDLGTHALTAGQHTFRVQIVGANPSAVLSYMFGLDYVKLEPPFVLRDALNLGNPAGQVAVVFSTAVDPSSATNLANYAIDNGVVINSAQIGSAPQTVLLQTTGLADGAAYTLTVSNVTDLASNLLPATTRPIEQNLNTWLRLDETTGTTAADSSGRSHTGTLVAGAAPGYAGKVLRSVKFDGAGGHVRLPDGYANFATNGLTIALWAMPTVEGGAANWARFTDFGNGPSTDNILFARNGTSSVLTFEVYESGASGGKVNSPSGTLVLNEWQHLAATLDISGHVVLYRNGTEVSSGSTAVPGIVTRTANFLGRSNWSGDGYFAGKMDDVRVYDRVLSPEAILALANGGGPGDTDPSLSTVTVEATVPTTALSNAPPGVFTVSRTGDTTLPVTVQYAMSGNALNGVNYTNLIGSIEIPAGAANAQIYVTPIDGSFPEISRVATLNLAGGDGYLIGDSDQASVTIQNNNLVPIPLVATVVNATGTVSTNTLEVWFSSPVTLPSAIDLANYALLNSPGVAITNASLGARELQVILSVSAPLPASARLIAHGIEGAGGNSSSNQIAVFSLVNPTVAVVANQYQQGRSAALTRSTDGLVQHDANVTTWTTYGGAQGLSDFVGLAYSQPWVFGAVKVDLGYQFVDGGDWAATPRLYLLNHPVDTNQDPPESDPVNWTEVPGVLVSGNEFDPAVDAPTGTPPPNSPIVFDLSRLPYHQRTGYGWAVGGVPGDGPVAQFVSIAELRGFGVSLANLGAPKLAITTTGGNVVLSWPDWAGGYVLHSSPQLWPSPIWSPVGEIPHLAGDHYELSLPIAETPVWYRLAK